MSDDRRLTSPYGRRGLAVRLMYLGVAAAWWLGQLARRHRRGGIVVLCYHNVTGRQAARFDWQMKVITHHALTLDACSEPRTQVRRGVCVTFDDAFVSLREHAVPVLENRGVPATIFAVTGRPGDPPFWAMPQRHPDRDVPTMNQMQLADIERRSGIRVESHTDSHPDLRALSDEEVRRECLAARLILQRRLGRPVTHLALPFGSGDERVCGLAHECGYDFVYGLGGGVHRPASSFTMISRCSVSPDMWKLEFRLTVAGAYRWLGAWRRWWRRNERIVSSPSVNVPMSKAA